MKPLIKWPLPCETLASPQTEPIRLNYPRSPLPGEERGSWLEREALRKPRPGQMDVVGGPVFSRLDSGRPDTWSPCAFPRITEFWRDLDSSHSDCCLGWGRADGAASSLSFQHSESEGVQEQGGDPRACQISSYADLGAR